MNHIIHNLIQGTPEWAEHRARHLNASDAAAMLGISDYQTRSELLRQKATGLQREIIPAEQERFDNGHRREAEARPWAEEIIGADLFPIIASADIEDLSLSASFDGATMAEDIIFEHKTLNQDLAKSLDSGIIPEQYKPQMEQQLLIIGATKCLFMASNGSRDTMRHAWYESEPAVKAKLLAGWRQFVADVAAYQPAEDVPTVNGQAPEQLPALHIEVTGMVTNSNLSLFKTRALSVINAINVDLQTDVDFASAEKTVKWCGEIEDRLDAAKQHALSQTASIDELFRAIDEIKALARTKRLELDRLVKSRKESIRSEIVRAAQTALSSHVEALNKRLGKFYMPAQDMMRFGACIKGLKSISSLRDAVSVEIANAKISASSEADRIEMNLKTLRELAADHAFLFHDTAQIVLKANDDLIALVRTRIADHKAEEERRLESERTRIRQEEEARANKAVEDKRLAEERAKQQEQATAAPPATVTAPIPAIVPSVTTPAPQAAVAAPAAVPTMESRVDAYLAPLALTPKKQAEIRKHILAFLEFCAVRE